MLLRHGIAVDAAEVGGSDEARTLTAEGREISSRAAWAMRSLGVRPDTIWTSPLPRAAQTAELTAKALGCPQKVQADEALKPGARPQAFVNLLQTSADDASVMLVGHNPDLELFLSYLVSARGEAGVTLKKGVLAIGKK